MMKDFATRSPLKILERASHKELGQGNLGVLIARAGVGKTACLIHIAFHKILCGEKMVHISMEDTPEKITAYFNVILSDIIQTLHMDAGQEQEIRALIDRNRMILAYLNQSFQIERLRENMKNLVEKITFVPQALIVDGLDFEKAEPRIFEGFREIAREFQLEIWFSALSHRHIKEVNERGIPYPCSTVDDFFSVIIQLEPNPSHVLLRLLKNHDSPVPRDATVKLDPNTCLALA